MADFKPLIERNDFPRVGLDGFVATIPKDDVERQALMMKRLSGVIVQSDGLQEVLNITRLA